MDYQKIIHTVVDPLVEDKDSLLIRQIDDENGKDIQIVIATNKVDTARLIGKKGIIANAIREVVSIAGKSEEKHIHLQFESFEEETVAEWCNSFFIYMVLWNI